MYGRRMARRGFGAICGAHTPGERKTPDDRAIPGRLRFSGGVSLFRALGAPWMERRNLVKPKFRVIAYSGY
jgi:hypothetical protein